MNQIKTKKNLLNWELVSVNPNDKNWDWKDLFFFWGCNIQSVIGFSLIASIYLVYELNVFVVLLGTLIASFLVYFFANLIGKPSQKYGLPFPVILRSSFGIKGAKYFSLARGLVGIFMFGIQTYFLSRLFSFLIRILIFSFDSSILGHDIFLIFLLGLNIVDWVAFIFTILLQAFLFSKSHQFNRSIIKLSAVTVYSGMLIFFLTVFLYDVKVTSAAFIDIFSINNLFDKNNIAPLITVVGTIFAYFSIVIVNFGDFSRYVKNDNELKNGNLKKMIAELHGKITGCALGRGGSMHLIDSLVNVNAAVPIVGSTIPIGVGKAWANKLKKNFGTYHLGTDLPNNFRITS